MLSSPDPAQVAARSIGSMSHHLPARPPPPPTGPSSGRLMRGHTGPPTHPPPSSPGHYSSGQPQPTNHQAPSPQPPKPKGPTLKVEDFRHDPASGTFSVALPTGVTLTAKNPFALQSKVLMAAKPEIRPALAEMMTDVTMQWSTCTSPSLQDAANDAVDESRKKNYLESAKLLCSVRDKIPAPKLDVLRHKCMTMEDTVKWLLSMEEAKPDDVVRQTGLAEHKYYHMTTGELNEEGKTKVDSLSDEERKALKGWFNRSEEDIQKQILAKCMGTHTSQDYPAKPLHGVHRVCVFNLRKAYDNQASSILKAISDHQKLKKGRQTILIFVAVLLAIVIIVVIVVVVMRNKKRAKEDALTEVMSLTNGVGKASDKAPLAPTPPDATKLSSFVKSLVPPSSTLTGSSDSISSDPMSSDPMDAEIDRLALEIPK